MRSWGNRPDTTVVDEPFYAYYLKATGKAHPGANEVMAKGETDWRKVVLQCSNSPSGGKPILFQKQMTHHLLPEVDRSWLSGVTNCFLIRDPVEVITSYIKRNKECELEDLGFVQQAEIFDWVKRNTGRVPAVVDARDILMDPERILHLLCQAVGVEFNPAMLSWPAGPRRTDGVWAKYWYDEVERSTSFRPYRVKAEPVPDELRDTCNRCRECYERLYQYRLR